MLTAQIASAYGKSGVRVNAVLPGPTDTPAVESVGWRVNLEQTEASLPVGRIAQPEESPMPSSSWHPTNPRSPRVGPSRGLRLGNSQRVRLGNSPAWVSLTGNVAHFILDDREALAECGDCPIDVGGLDDQGRRDP